jgi:hypothetical protein
VFQNFTPFIHFREVSDGTKKNGMGKRIGPSPAQARILINDNMAHRQDTLTSPEVELLNIREELDATKKKLERYTDLSK